MQGKIFTANKKNFISLALEVFRFQYEYNPVYRQYCDILKINSNKIDSIQKIPFLPVRFFKTHRVATTEFESESVFESSGTSQTVSSKHYVKDISLYEKSFNDAFRLFYADPAEWCIIALLPSYLERNNSSLVMMADKLIQQSLHPQSGFYLNEWGKLQTTLHQLERLKQKTLLIGVTFALLDFAGQCPMQLRYTTIMETGGMKGKREEMTRQQVHEILCNSFHLQLIHSEYGMTELLSQAYSTGHGTFNCPPWMKVLLREEDDPFAIHIADTPNTISGAVNIIDLANIYSCSFIATEDAGKLHTDGGFEILGRLDNTDIRGCSLLAL
jgi:phenylacetate-coenzyme A ligase PaaK-like adenylate-forming protein